MTGYRYQGFLGFGPEPLNVQKRLLLSWRRLREMGLKEKNQEFCFKYIKFEMPIRHPSRFVKCIFNI